MKDKIKRTFKGGTIWEHDIQSANEIIEEYVRSIGGDEVMAWDILDLIHNSSRPLNSWDGELIIRLVEDYIDR